MRRLLLAIFALGIVLRMPTFSRPLLSDDEAIYATTANALGRGDLLYRDVVDHKPPLIYHLYQLGFVVFGAYNTGGAHAFVVLAVLLAAAFLLAIAREGDPGHGAGTGLAAAGLFLVFSTTWHDYDALAANCELFLLAPQAAAGWLLLRDLRKATRGGARAATHLAVGVLIGMSALLKYQGLSFLGASLGLLLWWAFVGRESWSSAITSGACQLLGALLPPALYLSWCGLAGNAGAAIYWFEFNVAYLRAGLTGATAAARGLRRTALIGGTAFVPYGLGLAAAFAAARRAGHVVGARWRRAPAAEVDTPPPSVMLALFWLGTSAIAAASGGRFFGHYFHLILPPLCLLAAPAFRRIWVSGRLPRAALVALCAIPALFFFALATISRPLAASWDQREPPYEEVAARIDALTVPGQRIFVWGNSPQLYVAARRPMGARFSFCNYMTGESPGTPTENGVWSADGNQLPAAWDMLLDDLERRRPSLFVDAAAAGWDGYAKYPLARYPRLRAYVERRYRPVETSEGVVIYRRIP